MHKHGFMRALTVFLLIITLVICPGLMPETAVYAASVTDLKAQRAALEDAEAENRARSEQLQGEIIRLQERIGELKNAIRKAPRRSLSLFREYTSCLQRLEAAQKQAEENRTAAETLARERDALEKALAEQEKIYRETLAAASLNAGGRMVWDPQWPVPGYSAVSCMFGENGHRGTDITGAGIAGTPIRAAEDGEVIWSGWMDSYGYCVFLDHGNGFSTRYAHAAELSCTAGERVSAGEIIAYVGSTGNSTGPHLHFEVLRSGELQDPLQYFE